MKHKCCATCQPRLSSARSNNAGACHTHITTAWKTVAVMGSVSRRHSDDSGAFQPPPSASRSGAGRPQASTPPDVRRCEQEGRDQHDQLMLDHVQREAALAALVERRNQCKAREPPSPPRKSHGARRCDPRAVGELPPAGQEDEPARSPAGRHQRIERPAGARRAHATVGEPRATLQQAARQAPLDRSVEAWRDAPMRAIIGNRIAECEQRRTSGRDDRDDTARRSLRLAVRTIATTAAPTDRAGEQSDCGDDDEQRARCDRAGNRRTCRPIRIDERTRARRGRR